jgi:hypothetical protein
LIDPGWIHIGSKEAGPRVAAVISVVETCRRLNGSALTMKKTCKNFKSNSIAHEARPLLTDSLRGNAVIYEESACALNTAKRRTPSAKATPFASEFLTDKRPGAFTVESTRCARQSFPSHPLTLRSEISSSTIAPSSIWDSPGCSLRLASDLSPTLILPFVRNPQFSVEALYKGCVLRFYRDRPNLFVQVCANDNEVAGRKKILLCHLRQLISQSFRD